MHKYVLSAVIALCVVAAYRPALGQERVTGIDGRDAPATPTVILKRGVVNGTPLLIAQQGSRYIVAVDDGSNSWAATAGGSTMVTRYTTGGGAFNHEVVTLPDAVGTGHSTQARRHMKALAAMLAETGPADVPGA
jgi:hypothetical protein